MANQANGTRIQVWSASYAGVEVFQQLYNGTAVMRRRKDSFVNATQILKCAQYDKPHRTRFLEREIHSGIHEKVQGGYGKYQGTWVPLDRAIGLARRLNVFEALRSLLEYNPASGTAPPTAPRSLESMHKRKSKHEVGRPPKRLISRGAARTTQSGRPGSLNTILNTNTGTGVRSPEFTPHSQQQTVVAGNGWVPAITADCTPTFVHRGGESARPMLAQLTPETPGSGHAANAATAGSPTYSRGDPTRFPLARGRGRRAYHTSGHTDHISNGHTSLVVGGDGVWALRDISNTYQSPGARPENAKESASLLTPPSTIRRGGLPSSAHTAAPSVVLGSPATCSAMTEPPADSEGAWARDTPPVCPQSAPGSTHTSPNVTAAARSEQTLPPDDSEVGQRFIEFVRRTRTEGSIPAELERYVTRSPALDVGAELGLHGTALHEAVANGHWDIVQMLMRRGANAARGNRHGLTPLMLAISSYRAWHQRGARVFEWLLDTLSTALVKRDRKGRTLAHWVALGPSEDRDLWPQVSVYYARLLARKLVQCGHAEIFAWQDYSGKRADQLAWESGLSALALLLEEQSPDNDRSVESTAEDHQSSRPLDSALKSVTEPIPEPIPEPEPVLDPYTRFASQAADIIRQSAADMRKDHLQAQRVIDEDTKYAAKLLLDLRSERDSAQRTAREYQGFSEKCVDLQDREHALRRKVECAVNLQVSARVTTAAIAQHQYQHSVPRRTSSSNVEELRAEYQMLRQSAASYEHHSRRLASEYAELTSVVKPWARPVLTALFSVTESSEEDRDDAMSMLGKLLGTATTHYRPKRPLYNDPEVFDVNSIKAVLETEELRLQKLESVVSAACGDMPLDRVRSVVGPVLSLLNNGSTL
ncbi:Transcription factor mbp1 [Coemansia sp. RSA 1365]|nr:Transcription factor mbp1 [Coemansia sp. RSA 1365]